MNLKEALLDRTLFLVILGAISLGILGLLIYGQFMAENPVSQDELVEVPSSRVPAPMPLNAYHSGFSPTEVGLMMRAADAWRSATKKVVDVVLIEWEPPTPFFDDTYRAYPERTVWHLDPGSAEAALLMARYSIKTDGFAVGNYAVLLKNPELTDQQFLTAFAHELGHLVGLEHIRAAYPALMNLHAKDAITEWDVLQVEYVFKTKMP